MNWTILIDWTNLILQIFLVGVVSLFLWRVFHLWRLARNQTRTFLGAWAWLTAAEWLTDLFFLLLVIRSVGGESETSLATWLIEGGWLITRLTWMLAWRKMWQEFDKLRPKKERQVR